MIGSKPSSQAAANAVLDEYEVVVAGGGPVGLMLAGELALAGVGVAVLERRPDQALAGSRASGLRARTLEELEQRGIADRFLARAQLHPLVMFGGSVLDISDLPTRHPYTVAIFQNEIERLLAEWVAEGSVPILYDHEVTGFAQDDDRVEVRLADGRTLRAGWLVGCDGGRSSIRHTAGIPFPGWEATRSNLIAEAEMTDPPAQELRHDEAGVHAIGRTGEENQVRVVVTERQLNANDQPTLEDVSERLIEVFGTDYAIRNPTWISRFTDATRHADTYRAGRVLIAGDAAHIHYPAGGQGLSLGLGDAVNLGWKLAQVVRGASSDDLLDTYTRERHPVAARVLRHTMAQTALQRRDSRVQALVEVVSEIATLDEPRHRIAGLMSGLDIHYPLGDGHPLLGRRMPDLDLTTAEGPRRVSQLLRAGRPVLLELDEREFGDLASRTDRVKRVRARYDGDWTLPIVGSVEAPGAVLIRPDGYVAWTGSTARPA